jgi:hypothetical protein
VCLGQALFKVCNCLEIVPKVSANNLWVMQLTFDSLGWAHHLWQCQEQWYYASRIHTVLSPQDQLFFWCKAPSHQVSLPAIKSISTSLFHFHRCLVHIINLATQAVIAKCSKAK